MGAKGSLDLQSVDKLWPGPPLGRLEYDHRPAGPGVVVVAPCVILELLDIFDGLVDGGGHELMHRLRLIAFHEVRRPAAAAEELVQFVVLDAGQHGWIADLVAVQVQDRQNRSVGDGVEKLIRLPRGGEGSGFRLPSPMTQATIRPGLSKAAPKAWLSEYPNSPPS